MFCRSFKSIMDNYIRGLPEQLREAGRISENIKPVGNFEEVLVCGMGGSGLPGDLLQALEPNFAVSLHKDYGLPSKIGENTLIFTISYSGNTEETISSFNAAVERNLFPIVITSGGQLEKLARGKQALLIKVPSGLQPRMAIGYQFGALWNVLRNIGLVDGGENDLSRIADIIETKMDSLESLGKEIALKIYNKIPCVISTQKNKALAYFWKIAINETGKSPVFCNVIPELCHNELVGFSRMSYMIHQIKVIMLQDPDDHERNLKRMGLFSDLLRERAFEPEIVWIRGEDRLTKIFISIAQAYWTSYYLARAYNVDPMKVDIVEDFKKRLEEA